MNEKSTINNYSYYSKSMAKQQSLAFIHSSVHSFIHSSTSISLKTTMGPPTSTRKLQHCCVDVGMSAQYEQKCLL
jgi:hypothetical protein